MDSKLKRLASQYRKGAHEFVGVYRPEATRRENLSSVRISLVWAIQALRPVGDQGETRSLMDYKVRNAGSARWTAAIRYIYSIAEYNRESSHNNLPCDILIGLIGYVALLEDID